MERASFIRAVQVCFLLIIHLSSDLSFLDFYESFSYRICSVSHNTTSIPSFVGHFYGRDGTKIAREPIYALSLSKQYLPITTYGTLLCGSLEIAVLILTDMKCIFKYLLITILIRHW